MPQDPREIHAVDQATGGANTIAQMTNAYYSGLTTTISYEHRLALTQTYLRSLMAYVQQLPQDPPSPPPGGKRAP